MSTLDEELEDAINSQIIDYEPPPLLRTTSPVIPFRDRDSNHSKSMNDLRFQDENESDSDSFDSEVC